jgi:hypothetical protein
MVFKKIYLKTIKTHHATEEKAHKAAMIYLKSFSWWERIFFLTSKHVFEYKYFEVCNIRGNDRGFYYG